MGQLDNRRRYGKTEVDDSKNYLTLTALESGTFTFTIPSGVGTNVLTSISYSTNNGASWVTTNNSSSQVTITTPTISAGASVLWKGSGTKISNSSSARSNFASTGRFNANGNPLSLLYGDNFASIRTISATYALAYLFYGCSKLVKATIALPATTLSTQCYYSMFSQCSSLTDAPELPALTMQTNCYTYMFQDCVSLTTAPELPATTLAQACYTNMFKGCRYLTTVQQKLPALTLATSCYAGMFEDCVSLTTAPELPAEQYTSYCYYRMFYNCAHLSYIKAMLKRGNNTSNSLTDWVNSVGRTGTFVRHISGSWVTGNSGIPSGWTVQTASS